ncbi:MAG: glycosyltransferase [Planctomycetales bacterium]
MSTFDRKGGAEQIAWNLLEAYARAGHQSWLAVGEKLSDHPDVFEIPEDPYGRTWKRTCIETAAWLDRHFDQFFKLGVRLDNYAQDLRSLVKLREELDFEQGRENFEFYGSHELLNLTPARPDIVHCHNLHVDYFDLRYLAKLSHTVPTVLTLHDAWLSTGHCAHSFDCQRWRTGCGSCPDLEIYPPIEADGTAANWKRKKQIYEKCKLYVTSPGKWLLNRMQESILSPGVVEWKHIPNGVRTDCFRPADRNSVRQSLGIPSEARVLMFAGNFLRKNPFKDLTTLRGALQIIGQRPESENLLLLAVGDAGETQRVGHATLKYISFVSDPFEMATY